MNREKGKAVKLATQSLQEMLRRIGPFLPKPPKSKHVKPPKWEVMSEGTFPSMPLPKQGQGAKETGT